MKNRYRIWIRLAAVTATVALLASCMAPVPRPTGTQHAPNMSRSLAPDASYMANRVQTSNPADASGTVDDEAQYIPGQRVVKVGLLLPLSGRSAELGKALQDAASVSLFDKYARLSVGQQIMKVELLPKDTGDTPEQAAKAMNDAIAGGAQFIIGPLFADATTAAAPVARARNISVLSLSNNRGQASVGTYMFGFSPAEQTERIINYAYNNNKTRIAVLAPNSALGETVLAAARETAGKREEKLAAEVKYLPQGAGMETALNTLVPPGKPIGFDAILIPEGGAALETIMRGLSSRGVKPSNVQFLGTGIWDDSDLLRRVNLDTAWLASSPPQLTSQFEARFKSTYSYSPPRIASLTYDAVALAVTLATSGRAFDADSLTNNAGFAGPANGIFRLRANGMVQRGLAVMRVNGSTLQVISSAPLSF